MSEEECHPYQVEVETAGSPKALFFEPGVSCCGEIEDGVVFRFAGEGCWVVPYTELWRLVSLAREARKEERA